MFFFRHHCKSVFYVIVAILTCVHFIWRHMRWTLSRLTSQSEWIYCTVYVYVGSWRQASTALRAPFGAITPTASSSRSTPETRQRHSARWRGRCSPWKVEISAHLQHCSFPTVVQVTQYKRMLNKLILHNVCIIKKNLTFAQKVCETFWRFSYLLPICEAPVKWTWL